MDADSERKALDEITHRAHSHYRSGRVTEAAALFEQVARSPHVAKPDALEASFWLGTCLHALGELERAIDLLEPICFDEQAVVSARLVVYRIATRTLLLLVDLGAPMARTRRLLARTAEIGAGIRAKSLSRLQLARGYALEAQGQRARALRCYERGYATRGAEAGPFASTRYLRSLVPALIRAGRLEEARTQLEGWLRSPDPFAAPHLQICWAEFARTRGEPVEAVRWAFAALRETERDEDLAGEIGAARALCQSAPLAGRVASTHIGLRALLGKRRRAGADQRHAIDLACLDAQLGLACLHAGLPVRDYTVGRHYADEHEQVLDRTKARRALARAERACARAARSAAAVDAVFESGFRQRDVRRRARHLEEVRRAVARSRPAPGAPLRRPPPVAFPTAPPREDVAVVLRTGLDGTRIVAPTTALEDLVKTRSPRSRCLVLHPGEGGLVLLDWWWRGRRLGSAEVGFDRDEMGPRAVLYDAAVPTPSWMHRLAAELAQQEAKRCRERGDAALERGEKDEAARHYEASLALAPASSRTAERLGHCLLALGRRQEAKEHVLRALELDSSAAAPWRTLAATFEADARNADASEAYAQALERLDEEDSEAREQIEEGLRRVGAPMP